MTVLNPIAWECPTHGRVACREWRIAIDLAIRAVEADTCPVVMVGNHPGQPTELFTCAQREGHPGGHNRNAPSDGCTAWADHCPRCAEHDCVCPAVTP